MNRTICSSEFDLDRGEEVILIPLFDNYIFKSVPLRHFFLAIFTVRLTVVIQCVQAPPLDVANILSTLTIGDAYDTIMQVRILTQCDCSYIHMD